jgi:Gpi18-like mannosyltransferase
VLALWLLNPLVIFGSAIFARHDSLSVFLVVLSVFMATQGHRYLGLGLLALSAAIPPPRRRSSRRERR